VEREVDKRNKLYKWISKNGCVTECQRQTEPLLKQWIAGYVKKQNKKIDNAAVEYLIERVGTDMETLINELDKLIGYSWEKDTIEPQDIDAVCSGVIVSRIFDMIDAVARKEKDKALTLYADLVANREQPMSILYLFSRHINILLQVKELAQRGLNKSEMAKKIGIPPFTVPKYAKQAEQFKRSQLIAMQENRLDYEEDFKRGKISDQLAVEMFFIQALTND
jgi:DNA polymerase-3 subunit delta